MDFIAVTSLPAGKIDIDFIVCAVMIISGFFISKSKNKKAAFAGRAIFGIGTAVLVWLVLWQTVPYIMAEIIYGFRV